MNKKVLGWTIAGALALGTAASFSPLIFAEKPSLECTINEKGEKEFGKVIKIESLAQMKAYLNQSEIAVLGFGPDGWTSPSKKIDYQALAGKFKTVPFLYVEFEKHKVLHNIYNPAKGFDIYVYIDGKNVPGSDSFSRYVEPGWGLEFYIENYQLNKKKEFDQISYNSFKKKKKEEENK